MVYCIYEDILSLTCTTNSDGRITHLYQLQSEIPALIILLRFGYPSVEDPSQSCTFVSCCSFLHSLSTLSSVFVLSEIESRHLSIRFFSVLAQSQCLSCILDLKLINTVEEFALNQIYCHSYSH